MVKFRVSSSRSRAWFEARSTLHPITGEIIGLEGFIEAEIVDGHFDLSSPVEASGELSVDRLVSGNPLYDKETMRRIDARRYPTISGQLQKLEALSDENHYRSVTDITFHGVTRPVEGEIRLGSFDGRSLALEGEHTFDMRDFGVDPPKMLILKVHPEIKVRVHLVAEREEGR